MCCMVGRVGMKDEKLNDTQACANTAFSSPFSHHPCSGLHPREQRSQMQHRSGSGRWEGVYSSKPMQDPGLTVCDDASSQVADVTYGVSWSTYSGFSATVSSYPTLPLLSPPRPNTHICCDVASSQSCWVPRHVNVRAPRPYTVIKCLDPTRYSASEQLITMNLWGSGNGKEKTKSSGPPTSFWGVCSMSWKAIRNKRLILFTLSYPSIHTMAGSQLREKYVLHKYWS